MDSGNTDDKVTITDTHISPKVGTGFFFVFFLPLNILMMAMEQ